MAVFIAFDGESIGSKYILLGDSLGNYLWNDTGLSTEECLVFLTHYREGVRVFYGMRYDVNMIVSDLDKNQRTMFFKGVEVNYKDFKIQMIGNRIFKIRYKKRLYTYYDVIGFYQTSFINALQSVNISCDDIILWGKQARNTFDVSQREAIIKYNRRECELLVQMMKSLDEAFVSLNIKLRSWHGAGALADAVISKLSFVQKNLESYEALPTKLFESAFYGARIELLKLGYVESVSVYDINSAYPYAISKLPDLTGKWYHEKRMINDEDVIGIHEVEFDLRDWQWNENAIRHCGLLPYRAKDGYISMPRTGRGWYWTHEVKHAIRQCKKWGLGAINVKQSFVTKYHITDWSKIIPDFYHERRVYKRKNDGRQMPLKLFLNSCYGKFAQLVGKHRFHCGAWASFITSHCRTQLLQLTEHIPALKIIGFATDSIVLTEPILDNFVSSELGALEKKVYSDGNVFLMPGLVCYNYRGKQYERVRGYRFIDGLFNWHDCIDKLNVKRDESDMCESGECPVTVQMFITHRLADLHPVYEPYRCRVLSEYNEGWPNCKTIRPFRNTKRDYDFLYTSRPYLYRLDETLWDSKIPLYQRGYFDDGTHSSFTQSRIAVDEITRQAQQILEQEL